MIQENPNKSYKVLSLDGGGGKGAYTLGVLRELEKMVGKPLNQEFDLFYGTSTGSIIAAALAFGATVEEIKDFYMEHLPKIMSTWFRKDRSEALRVALESYFEKRTFSDLSVGLGIVTTNDTDKKAMIFKSLLGQAHGMKSSFVPGFGVTIAEAVEASCSAIPFFEAKLISPANGSPVQAVDGGFVANNPSLYALIDATQSLNIPTDKIRFLSVGTGTYPEKFPLNSLLSAAHLKPALKMISMQFAASANSTEIVFNLLSKGIAKVRVNDTFAEPELSTSLFEHRTAVLERLLAKGRYSFGKHEQEIIALLK